MNTALDRIDPGSDEWKGYIASAVPERGIVERLEGDFSTLFGAIALPINPLKDATPAPVYGVAQRDGSEL